MQEKWHSAIFHRIGKKMFRTHIKYPLIRFHIVNGGGSSEQRKNMTIMNLKKKKIKIVKIKIFRKTL